MPSDKKAFGRRRSIAAWRVKAGNREVFRGDNKMACEIFVRENKTVDGKKTKLIPPNKAGKRR
jgi:hypothetical protein